MSTSATVPGVPRDPALLTITHAFVEIVVTSGYTPPLEDAAVTALADTLATYFDAAGIPVNPAEAVTHFAVWNENDKRIEERAQTRRLTRKAA